MTQRALFKRLAATAGIALVSISAHAAKTELTVYTAIEAEDLKKYAARFNEDNPQTSKSTGCAILLASSRLNCWQRKTTLKLM